MKTSEFSLFSVVCAFGGVAHAGGNGRMEPHNEMRAEPSKQIERMMTLHSGIQRQHNSLLGRIRSNGCGLKSVEIDALRQKIHQDAPEMVAHVEGLLRILLESPLKSDPNIQKKKDVAVDVLKTRLNEPIVVEDDENLVLPQIDTVVNSIERLRAGLGMPSGGGLHLARHMMPADLAEYLVRTRTDIVNRAKLLEASDPAEAQFIGDILAVHPYLDLRGLHLEEFSSAE